MGGAEERGGAREQREGAEQRVGGGPTPGAYIGMSEPGGYKEMSSILADQ